MRNPSRVVISWLIGVVVIIALVLLANGLAYFANNSVISALVAFLNENVLLLLGISVFFALGALFYALGKGFDLLTPIFDAIGSVLTAVFLVGLIVVFDRFVGSGIGGLLAAWSIVIYILVFVLALVFGYIAVFRRWGRRSRAKESREEFYEERERPEREEVYEEVEERPERTGGRRRYVRKVRRRR